MQSVRRANKCRSFERASEEVMERQGAECGLAMAENFERATRAPTSLLRSARLPAAASLNRSVKKLEQPILSLSLSGSAISRLTGRVKDASWLASRLAGQQVSREKLSKLSISFIDPL